ncbi:MAG: hypothetical protein Q4E09_06635 [Eubacteriales bacterium]|nr:hypothetical protein [Eubacteriales bacterium]
MLRITDWLQGLEGTFVLAYVTYRSQSAGQASASGILALTTREFDSH